MIKDWQDECLVCTDKKGNLKKVSHARFGLLWVKEKGEWKTIELMKGAKKYESEIWSSL